MLEFHSAYQLTSEPLRIDVLIIKKLKDIPIRKNIAAVFRQENLLEYKSPIMNLTISFVESRHPRELLVHLAEIGDTRLKKLWLKDLSKRLEAPEIRRITAALNRYGKSARIGAYGKPKV